MAEPQILPNKAEARKSPEAEPTDPTMDSIEDRQHHQVRFHNHPGEGRPLAEQDAV